MKYLASFGRCVWSAGLAWCLAGGLLGGAVRAGVVAHWSFDAPDADGSYPDSVNNAHPAMPVDKSAVRNVAGAVPEKTLNAIALAGPSNPNSYLTIPPLTNIQSTSLTVAVWVNLVSPDGAFVLADWPNMNNSAYAFGFHPFNAAARTAQPNANLTSVETLAGRGTTGGNRRSIVDQKLRDKFVPLNEWHHFAWVWDRDAGALTSYLDGVNIGETKRSPTNTNQSKSLDLAMNNRRVRIGSQELSVSGSTPANLNGSIDELWIFDEPLTVIQLRNLIKDNDIHGAATTPLTGGGGTTTTGGSEPPPLASRRSGGGDIGRTAKPLGAQQGASTGRIIGILTCLTVIVTMSCYLVWAFLERAKLRAAR